MTRQFQVVPLPVQFSLFIILRMGFPGSSVGKKSACIAGDLGLISGLGQTPRKGRGYPLQYSGLENSMNSIGHGVRFLIIIFYWFLIDCTEACFFVP